MFDFETVGHRGAPKAAPENTLLSFKRAIDVGVDWIEFDLHESKDSVLVVIHDDTVDRTTDGKGRVSDMTFEELQRLDAGNGQKIPSLQQVIDLARGKVKLDMEIKVEDIDNDVADAIQKNGIIKKCMVSSFIYGSIKAVHEIDSNIETAAIMSKLPENIEKCLDTLFDDINTRTMMIGKKIAGEPFVREIRRRGFKVGIWNADTPEEIERYAYMEPYYLCSNYPGLLVEYKHVAVHI